MKNDVKNAILIGNFIEKDVFLSVVSFLFAI